jgi:heme O synthase-like polyprenyltransferase
MKNSKLVLHGLLQALGVAIYILGIAAIMTNISKILGEKDTFLTPVIALLLFVLSAAITGTLTLGRPILMYLDNKRTEAIKLFIFTLSWMFIILISVIVLQIIIR